MALVPSPWIVALPAIVVAPAFIVPVVLIFVAPAMTAVPFNVPPVIVGLMRVLLVKLSDVARPTKVSVVVGRVKIPPLLMELMTGASNVLLLKVAAPVSVTMTPDAGNTATELTPVPPEDVGKIPVTAADCDKSTAPKLGALPSLGIVKL